MSAGVIYMIPCPISDERGVWDVLPKANLEVMNSLDYFIVENVRTARRFLKKCDKAINIDELRNELRELISQKGKIEISVPMFGKYGFKAEDVDRLYAYIAEG